MVEAAINKGAIPGVSYSYGCEIRKEKGIGCGINEDNLEHYLADPKQAEVWKTNRDNALLELSKPVVVKTY